MPCEQSVQAQVCIVRICSITGFITTSISVHNGEQLQNTQETPYYIIYNTRSVLTVIVRKYSYIRWFKTTRNVKKTLLSDYLIRRAQVLPVLIGAVTSVLLVRVTTEANINLQKFLRNY